MGLEEVQERFELALEELNQECEKRKYPQNAIVWNNYGVFINFGGVEVNYSHYSLTDDVEAYFIQQEKKHEAYLRVLQDHRLQMKRDLKSRTNAVASFVQRFSKIPPAKLEQIINQTIIKVTFDKTLIAGSLLGHYFFEEFAKKYIKTELEETKTELEETRQKLMTHLNNIHRNTKALESEDQDRLQYFRNKQLLWYGNKG